MIKKIYVKDNSTNEVIEVKRVKSLKNMSTIELMNSGFGIMRY